MNMDCKMEEKTKYFFKNYSGNPKIIDFTISISNFEENLKNFIENNPTIIPNKNGYKKYGIGNKYFKIYQDGSCFGYSIKSTEFRSIEEIVEFKEITQQILNDDFPGLKTYWEEDVYEEIFFKIEENVHLVFSRVIDVIRNVYQYSIFIEPKDKTNISRRIKSIVDNLGIIKG